MQSNCRKHYLRFILILIFRHEQRVTPLVQTKVESIGVLFLGFDIDYTSKLDSD